MWICPDEIKVGDVIVDGRGLPFAKVVKVEKSGTAVRTSTFADESTRFDFDTYTAPFMTLKSTTGWDIWGGVSDSDDMAADADEIEEADHLYLRTVKPGTWTIEASYGGDISNPDTVLAEPFVSL